MQLQNEVRYKDESFYIGNGIFVTSDICIPLNAISTIKVKGKKTINLNLVLSMIAIGVLLLLIPSLRIAGCFIFACGLVTLGCLFLLRYLDKYGLVIQVNSGVSYLFEHEDLEFIRKIADIIRKGLDDSMFFLKKNGIKWKHIFISVRQILVRGIRLICHVRRWNYVQEKRIFKVCGN